MLCVVAVHNRMELLESSPSKTIPDHSYSLRSHAVSRLHHMSAHAELKELVYPQRTRMREAGYSSM